MSTPTAYVPSGSMVVLAAPAGTGTAAAGPDIDGAVPVGPVEMGPGAGPVAMGPGAGPVPVGPDTVGPGAVVSGGAGSAAETPDRATATTAAITPGIAVIAVSFVRMQTA